MAVSDKVREEILNTVKFDKDSSGLIPAVVQDPETKDVLMMGFMNRESLAKTLDSGFVTFWTRSRQKLWTKGETSGNTLNVVSIRVNCNDDSLLVMASPAGPTCHTGHPTCYYREAAAPDQAEDEETWRTITQAQFDPDEVYKK